jgi:hypothetical protein
MYIVHYSVETKKVFVFAFCENFRFSQQKIAKIIVILMLSCERGKFKTLGHLFSLLVDEFAIIFATFLHILMQKAKVFAKIRKPKTFVSTLLYTAFHINTKPFLISLSCTREEAMIIINKKWLHILLTLLHTYIKHL